jgi:cell division protein DivIC
MKNFFNNENQNDKVAHLNTYSKKKTLKDIRQHKRKRLVRLRSAVILAVGLIVIGFVSLPLYNNFQKTEEFNKVHAQVQADLDDLEREKAALEYEVSLLEDEEYIAKLARKELNLSKPNEILINLPQEDDGEEDGADNQDEDNENELE